MPKRALPWFVVLALGLVACGPYIPDPYQHPPCKRDDVTFPCKRGVATKPARVAMKPMR